MRNKFMSMIFGPGTVDLTKDVSHEDVYKKMVEHVNHHEGWSFGYYECRFIGTDGVPFTLTVEQWDRTPKRASKILFRRAFEREGALNYV